MPNCAVRYDRDHLDYVSLSISRVASLINISTTRWHGSKDLWWCVLSFRTHRDRIAALIEDLRSGLAEVLG